MNYRPTVVITACTGNIDRSRWSHRRLAFPA